MLLDNQQVLADGMFLSDKDLDNWVLQTEDQQLCAINYENGIQNTILAVDINEMQGERAVWIFPVPSKPDEINIDIIRGEELVISVGGTVFGTGIQHNITIPLQEIAYDDLKNDLKKIGSKDVFDLATLPPKLAEKVNQYIDKIKGKR